MKKIKSYVNRPWFQQSIALCIGITFYLLLSHLPILVHVLGQIIHFLAPVILGISFAYLQNPLVDFVEKYLMKLWKGDKKKGKILCHVSSVFLSFLFVLLGIILLFYTIIPMFYNNLVSLFSQLDSYQKIFQHIPMGDKIQESISMNDLINKGMKEMPYGVKTVWETSLGIGSTLLNILLGFILALYFLLEKERALQSIDKLRKSFLSESTYQRHTAFFQYCNRIFLKFLVCNFIDAFIIGIANVAFMMIFQMPYIVFLSVIIALTNLLPTIGPLIGGSIGFIILVVVNPGYAVIFLIFTIVLQTIDAYIIKPKLFGQSLGIPSFLILISILLGGKLFGMVGIFIAIPITTICYEMLKNYISTKE